MFNLFVQTTDDIVMENIENLNRNLDLTPDQLNKVLDNPNNPIFIVTKENYEAFQAYPTVGYDSRCTVVLINGSNINEMSDKRLKNAFLFVDSEERLLTFFEKIYKNVEGFIDLKFKELKYYDKEKLEISISKIADLVYQSDKDGRNLIVKQLNGYRIKEKFNQFGEIDYFVGLDGNVYYHPSFYYQQNKKGSICKIEDFIKTDDTYYHLSQPHLLCVVCETFYCNRDIYNNKKYTNEYKVPCTNSCQITTLLEKYSKKIFNKSVGKMILDPLDNLDRIIYFDDNNSYNKFLKNECVVNQIKDISFDKRKIWRSYDI